MSARPVGSPSRTAMYAPTRGTAVALLGCGTVNPSLRGCEARVLGGRLLGKVVATEAMMKAAPVIGVAMTAVIVGMGRIGGEKRRGVSPETRIRCARVNVLLVG